MNYEISEKRNRKYRLIVIFALILSVTGLSIAYSAMSESLEIHSVTYHSGDDWDIRFSNVQEPIIKGSAKEVKKPVITYTIIRFNVSVVSVGDSIEYHFDIKNGGNLDAKLDFEPLITNEFLAKEHNVFYTFTYADGNKIFKGDTLDAGETKAFKLLIQYIKGNGLSSTSTFSIESEILLNYVQN